MAKAAENPALHFIPPTRTYKVNFAPKRQRRNSNPEDLVLPEAELRAAQAAGGSPMRLRPRIRPNRAGMSTAEVEHLESAFLNDFCPDQDVLPEMLPSPPQKRSKGGHFRRRSLDVTVPEPKGAPAAQVTPDPRADPALRKLQSLPASQDALDRPIPKKCKTLFDAASQGVTELIEKFVAKTKDINKGDSSGRTALMLAATAGKASTVRELLRLGADPTLVQAKTKRSAVHLACLKGHKDVLQELLISMSPTDSALMLNAKDSYDLTPQFLAQLGEGARHIEVTEYLHSIGKAAGPGAPAGSGPPGPAEHSVEQNLMKLVMVATADIKFRRNLVPEGQSKHMWRRLVGPIQKTRTGAALREEMVSHGKWPGDLPVAAPAGKLVRTLSGLKNPDITQAVFQAVGSDYQVPDLTDQHVKI